MTRRSADNIAFLRASAADGATASEIARAVGVSVTTILNWAASEYVPLPTRSQARKKAWADPEVRAKMSAARKKALADPEVRAKMSAARKKAWADPEVRAKMSAARKKALADPEVRAKMSAARKKAWADPEVRAKMSAARKKALADPEVRAKMSAASKKALADPEVRARIKASRKGAKGVLIPRWVPLDLHDEFLDIAADDGEEVAASHIRRLKREMGAAA